MTALALAPCLQKMRTVRYRTRVAMSSCGLLPMLSRQGLCSKTDWLKRLSWGDLPRRAYRFGDRKAMPGLPFHAVGDELVRDVPAAHAIRLHDQPVTAASLLKRFCRNPRTLPILRSSTSRIVPHDETDLDVEPMLNNVAGVTGTSRVRHPCRRRAPFIAVTTRSLTSMEITLVSLLAHQQARIRKSRPRESQGFTQAQSSSSWFAARAPWHAPAPPAD